MVGRAQKRLWEAKETVRRCKERGQLPPDETAPRLPFEKPKKKRKVLRCIAREIDYVEPWASYLAPYVYAARKEAGNL